MPEQKRTRFITRGRVVALLVSLLMVIPAVNGLITEPVLAACPNGETEVNGQCVEKDKVYNPQADPATSKQCDKDGKNCKIEIKGCGDKSSSCGKIMSKLTAVVNLLSATVGIIAVAMIIFGGIEFSTSGGDPQRVASGKKHITNAIIALVAFVFLWAFLNFLIPGGLFNG